MVSTRGVYCRPGNLFKDFIVEEGAEGIGNYGRPKVSYNAGGGRTLRGCLADATRNDRDRWSQLQHPITHTIVQAGPPKAKPEDKLVLGERVFIIHAIDDCGGLDMTTIYYAEERLDVK